MRIEIDGHSTFVGTGGAEFDQAKPTILFLHGSGMDHRAWALQARWFAFHGYSVLAPDFPGHSLSKGDAPSSIEASAQWLVTLLDAVGVEQVHLVGHSQGFLSALELIRLAPERVHSLTGIGTAEAIPVNPALIQTAQSSAYQAAKMMLQWGFGPGIHQGLSPTPGMQPIGQGLQIMGRNPLAVDLQCCADYQAGKQALDLVTQPCAMILAGKDKMTPLKAGRATADALTAQLTVLPDVGHMLPIEAPRAVLDALAGFIASVET